MFYGDNATVCFFRTFQENLDFSMSSNKRYEGIAVVMIEKQCNLSYYDETCLWPENGPKMTPLGICIRHFCILKSILYR